MSDLPIWTDEYWDRRQRRAKWEGRIGLTIAVVGGLILAFVVFILASAFVEGVLGVDLPWLVIDDSSCPK